MPLAFLAAHALKEDDDLARLLFSLSEWELQKIRGTKSGNQIVELLMSRTPTKSTTPSFRTSKSKSSSQGFRHCPEVQRKSFTRPARLAGSGGRCTWRLLRFERVRSMWGSDVKTVADFDILHFMFVWGLVILLVVGCPCLFDHLSSVSSRARRRT